MNLRSRFFFRVVLTVIACTAPLKGADWYVAPAGDDTAEGSLARPFASIPRAQKSAAAGDTVLIRGGVYRMQESQITRRRGIFTSLIVLDKSGAPGKPIRYSAYKDEKPVFDCSDVKPKGARVSAFTLTGSWLHLQGLEVTGVQVTMTGHTQSICFESNGSHNILERLSMHDGQAIGIYHVRGSDNLFLNCDAWSNWDYTSEGGRGGNVDGFGCHPPKGSTGNVFRGCRAWFNSDDGYDLIGAEEPVVFENCWALYSGLTPTLQKTGDGNGFKAGGYGSRSPDQLPKPIPRHIIRFCLAVGNKASGFYANHHPGGSNWLNNTASRNGTNFNMLSRLSDNVTDVDGFGHELLNNLSYNSRRDYAKLDASKCKLANNSFTLGSKLTDKDFVAVDERELISPRKTNGDLPEVGFLRPVPSSTLAKAGIGRLTSSRK